MHPMDFEEFCLALGEAQMVRYIKECFEKRKPLERTLHEKAMLIFRQYMLNASDCRCVSNRTPMANDLLKMLKFRQLGADFDDQSLQQLPNAFYLGMFGINVADFLKIIYRSLYSTFAHSKVIRKPRILCFRIEF